MITACGVEEAYNKEMVTYLKLLSHDMPRRAGENKEHQNILLDNTAEVRSGYLPAPEYKRLLPPQHQSAGLSWWGVEGEGADAQRRHKSVYTLCG
jgi:hypothetical protein